MAEAAAPVATVAPANSEATEAAEHAALIAELETEGDSDGIDDARPAKARQGKSIPAAGETGDDTEADTLAESEEADGENEGEDPDGEAVDEEVLFESVDDFRDHAAELIKKGDTRALEEALGLEKGALKVNGAKVRWVQTQIEKATTALSTAQQKEAEAQAVIQGAQHHYGPIVQAKQHFASGQPQGVLAAARAVENHFGVKIADFVEAVVKAGRGEASRPMQADPEVKSLKETVQQLLAERQQQQQAAEQTAARTKHVATIGAKLKGTDLAKLSDGAALVYDKILASYDSTLNGYKLDLKAAIKATLDDPAVKWKLLQARKGRPPVPVKNGTKTPPPKLPAGPQRRRVVAAERPKSPADKEAAEKAALIAELDAEERRDTRRSRRA